MGLITRLAVAISFLYLVPIHTAHAVHCPNGQYDNNGVCTQCPAGQTGNTRTGATHCIEYKTLNTNSGLTAIMRAEKYESNEHNMCVNDGEAIYYGGLTTDPITNTIAVSVSGQTWYLKPDEELEPSFSITLTGMTANSQFDFYISASGNFTIDWGDGTAIQTITKANTTNTTYSHTYTAAGNYTVVLKGLATMYNSGTTTAAISFYSSTNKTKMTAIAGDLGSIFPILNATGTGSPRFSMTFYGCTGLTSIPADLFAGLNGAPVSNMFAYTFYSCTGLTSIPAGLFAGISGAPAESMFSQTFRGCSNLTGSIPNGLFGTFNNKPISQMFFYTFADCSGLTGSIPSDLFKGISGAPAAYMFQGTFYGCSGLTGSIPDGLFGNINGTPQAYMFSSTFQGCSGLTGPSATVCTDNTCTAFTPLYTRFPSVTADNASTSSQCYRNATGLSDYSTIPAAWK